MAAKNSALLKWLNIMAFLFTVLVNGLAGSTTILGGKNTAQLSDANPTLITPAGYVFSIWGVIYILLGVLWSFKHCQVKKEKTIKRELACCLS